MKTIIAAVILTVSFGTASAADTCKVFEYAELKDMPTHVLDKTRSRYYSDSENWYGLAKTAQTFEALNKWQDNSDVCRHEWERLNTVFFDKQRQEQTFSHKLKAWFCNLGPHLPEWLCGK